MRRRSFLNLSILAASGTAALAACGSGGEGGSATAAPSAGSSSAPASAGTSTPTTQTAPASVRLAGTANSGAAMTVDVGPLVRSGEHAVLRLSFETKETSTQTPHLSGGSDLLDVCLLDLASGVMWPELDTSREALKGATNYSVRAGEALVAHAVYDAPPTTLETAQVLVPSFGIALGVPVVEESDAAAEGIDTASVLASATLDSGEKGPIPLEFFSGAADGDLDVAHDEDTVEINLASDVSFAVDSADLTSKADSQLKAVIAQLGLYPSGGSLAITGHTDDVADEAYNQALSERRAKAVADRLAAIGDLDAWSLTVSGKGESEPRVEGTSDEARAANRRVEVLAEPAKPEEAESARLADLAQGDPPKAEGPVGTGPEGVETEVDGVGRLRFELAEATRVGSFLVGHVEVTSLDKSGTVLGNRMSLASPFDQRWADRPTADMASPDRLTLLVGGMRYLAADYRLASGERRPLTTLNLPAVAEGVAATIPVIWPDTGEETLMVDLPADKTVRSSVAGPVLRLTDVPVRA